MCKFCHNDWNKRHSVQAKPDNVFSSYGGLQIENGCITVNVGGSVARFPVNYCPICGRKLEDESRVPKREYQLDNPASSKEEVFNE